MRRLIQLLKSLSDPNAPRMLWFLLNVGFSEAVERFSFSSLLMFGPARKARLLQRRPAKVAILIDEYFGGWDTAYGGYGFLARRLVAKYLPNDELTIEVLLHGNKVEGLVQQRTIDGVKVYKLSASDRLSRYWLALKRYDAFLSIELTSIAAIQLASPKTPHILWIQDPRPRSEWDEIETVTLFPEPSYYDQKIYDFVAKRQRSIRFITQGLFLNDLARQLYSLPESVAIDYLPNPIDTPLDPCQDTIQKEDLILFLGRIDSVKRGWIFCEIAKRLPEYQFHILGAMRNNIERNSEVLAPYIDEAGRSRIPNLHFEGHVDGELKQKFLRRAKILVNTSIHEALPISFLEALAARTLIVSCRNPEALTAKFGFYTGPVLGNGFDRVDDFVDGIRRILGDENYRKQVAEDGYRYISANHSIARFQMEMRRIVFDEINKCQIGEGRRAVQ